MKKIAIIAAGAAALASAPAVAAPDSATAQGSASATVVAPITLEHDAGASLSFGTITAGGGGEVVVNRNNGNGSTTGDVSLLAGSTESADSFTVGGDNDRAYQVTTTGGTVVSGADTMDFTTNAKKNHTLDAGGVGTFGVGGTLTVPDGAAAGSYVGTYDATVAYN